MAPEASLTSFSISRLHIAALREQSRSGTGRAEAQRHRQEMANEDEMAEHHQAAAHRPPPEVRQRQCDGLHERARRVQHRQTLEPAADRESDEIDGDADRSKPEM